MTQRNKGQRSEGKGGREAREILKNAHEFAQTPRGLVITEFRVSDYFPTVFSDRLRT